MIQPVSLDCSIPIDHTTHWNDKIKKITQVYEGTKKEYELMREAVVTARNSKDRSTQVGYVVVTSDGKIIGRGYNRFLKGCNFNWIPPKDNKDNLNTKYPYVSHAETEAIADSINKGYSVKGCTLIGTLNPCGPCVSAAQLYKIREIVCFQRFPDTLDFIKEGLIKIAAAEGTPSSLEYRAIEHVKYKGLPLRYKGNLEKGDYEV